MGERTRRLELRRALARANKIALSQAGVVSRPQLYAVGVSRAQVRANLEARRWRRVMTQSVSIFTGRLDPVALHWAAVLEAGPRAQLDGASALVAGGLEHFTEHRIRVSVPRGARVRRAKGLDIRQTRRWSPDDLIGDAAPPRTRPAVAAVRAGLWARTDKEAALLLSMAVQQRLVRAEDLAAELLRIRRAPRRVQLQTLVLDLLGGAQSLGELEFARECRRRGLPEPSRQVVRRARNGRYYLDVAWERWGVVVEIDGIQHAWVNNLVPDALRQNDISLGKDTVLRIPLLGLRIAPDAFFDQVRQALLAAGCPLDDRRIA